MLVAIGYSDSAGDAKSETEKKLAGVVDTHKAKIKDLVADQTKVRFIQVQLNCIHECICIWKPLAW